MRLRAVAHGRPITYLEGGQPTPEVAGGRPRALVLLHGFPLNAAMWRPQLWAAPSGWRFVAPDFRGFGPDPSPEERARQSRDTSHIDDFAADVIDLLDALSIDRAVIAGLSMGGYAAFAVLRRAPSRVAGLILADTRATPDTPESRAGRLAMLERLDREGVAAVIDDMMPKLLGTTTRQQQPALEGLLRRLALENAPEVVRAALVRIMSRPDSTDLLRDIAHPTLVLAGAEDTLTPVAENRAIAERIDGAHLEIVPAAGHMSNLEQPRAFNDAVITFLASHF